MNAELKELLADMSIPKGREEDLEWLRRNLPIGKNRNHPKFKRAMFLIMVATPEADTKGGW